MLLFSLFRPLGQAFCLVPTFNITLAPCSNVASLAMLVFCQNLILTWLVDLWQIHVQSLLKMEEVVIKET